MASKEQLAAVVAIALGAPLVFLFTRAVADGSTRYEETPLRAVLGDERFEALRDGHGGFPHYLGDDRLAPDFTLRDKDGRPWRLADHRGRVVVLNFWSITCPPCLEEMPTLETLAHIAEEWGDVDVVAVSTDSGWDAVSAVMPPRSRLRVLFDPDKSVVNGKFGTRLYPETWIVDREGVIRFRFDGARDWSDPVVLDVIEQFR